MSFKRAVAGIGDDAAGRYGDFDFAGTYVWYGDFFNNYLARPCEDGCFHHTRFHHHALSFIVQYIHRRNVLTFGQPYYIIKVSFKVNLVKKIEKFLRRLL